MKTQTIAKQLHALGNPTRLAIYRQLVRAGETGMPVGKVQKALKIPASTLTHHLQRLIGAELVKQERDGNELFCSVNFDKMRTMINFLEEECCADVCDTAMAS